MVTMGIVPIVLKFIIIVGTEKHATILLLSGCTEMMPDVVLVCIVCLLHQFVFTVMHCCVQYDLKEQLDFSFVENISRETKGFSVRFVFTFQWSMQVQMCGTMSSKFCTPHTVNPASNQSKQNNNTFFNSDIPQTTLGLMRFTMKKKKKRPNTYQI